MSKERLTDETLDNAIRTYKTVVEFSGNIFDEDYSPILDKATLSFLEELKQYRELEEQGLLLRLPCKVGDKIYIVTKYHHQDIDMSTHEDVEEVEVENIVFGRPYWQINYDEHEFLPDDFGKTVFLTKAEAEEKLRELEGK